MKNDPAPFIYPLVLTGGAEPPVMLYRYGDALRRVPPHVAHVGNRERQGSGEVD